MSVQTDQNHVKQSTWSELDVDSLVRSMVYWFGWNTLAERNHLAELAGGGRYGTEHRYGDEDGVEHEMSVDNVIAASERLLPTTITLTDKHVVRLEDPLMLVRLTELLGLSEAVREKAKSHEVQNIGGGTSSERDKLEFGSVTWNMMWQAAPSLAQRIWSMAQR